MPQKYIFYLNKLKEEDAVSLDEKGPRQLLRHPSLIPILSL